MKYNVEMFFPREDMMLLSLHMLNEIIVNIIRGKNSFKQSLVTGSWLFYFLDNTLIVRIYILQLFISKIQNTQLTPNILLPLNDSISTLLPEKRPL